MPIAGSPGGNNPRNVQKRKGTEVKVFATILWVVTTLLMLTAPVTASAKTPFMLKERKELALFSCLSRNYKSIGIDISSHEWSPFHPRYKELTERRSVDYDIKYIEFMDKHTGNFYKEQIAVKAEIRQHPFTTIFAKRMEFSESKALRDFIIKNPL